MKVQNPWLFSCRLCLCYIVWGVVTWVFSRTHTYYYYSIVLNRTWVTRVASLLYWSHLSSPRTGTDFHPTHYAMPYHGIELPHRDRTTPSHEDHTDLAMAGQATRLSPLSPFSSHDRKLNSMDFPCRWRYSRIQHLANSRDSSHID